MSYVCTGCGESWFYEYVPPEKREAFEFEGGELCRCPVCPQEEPPRIPEEQARFEASQAVGNAVADRLAALAASLFKDSE